MEKEKTIYRLIRLAFLWPSAFILGIVNVILGLENPREFAVLKLGYIPGKPHRPKGTRWFHNWLSESSFGWYFSRNFWYYTMCQQDKLTNLDKNLLRYRVAITLPFELLYSLFRQSWTTIGKKSAKEYRDFIFKTMKLGRNNFPL